jgi:hypothetical protein
MTVQLQRDPRHRVDEVPASSLLGERRRLGISRSASSTAGEHRSAGLQAGGVRLVTHDVLKEYVR